MNEIKTTVKRGVIKTIRQAAPNAKTGMPGNLLINSSPDKPNWFSRRDLINQLLGAGLSGNIPVMAFIGCAFTYEELVITQEALDAGGGEYKHLINGREITYKKPGVHNIKMEIDLSTANVTEGTINVAKLSQMFVNTAQRPAVAPRQTTEQMIEEAAAGDPPIEEEENLAAAGQAGEGGELIE